MTSAKRYSVKECFYSPQGEGHRVGTMNVFLRFAGCNLQCSVEKEGFNCDTDFAKGEKLSLTEVVTLIEKTGGPCRNVIFTGGEPALQLDMPLVSTLRAKRYYLAIETNGTRKLPHGIHYIACSPKPGSPPVIQWADEVRCVIKPGQVPDLQGLRTFTKFVSPAAYAPSVREIPKWKAVPSDLQRESIDWAVDWCRKNPDWRISIQTHKILGVR